MKYHKCVRTTAICTVLLLSGCATPDENVAIPTPTQPNTPTPVIGPQPNSNEAMSRANLHGTGVYSSGGIHQLTGLKWKFKTDRRSVDCTPAVFDEAIYFGNDLGYMYALDTSTGQEKWKFKAGNLQPSSPAIAEGIVYFGTEHVFYALDSTTGLEKWRYEADDKNIYMGYSAPAVTKEGVYFGGTGGLYVLDLNTGQEKWRFEVDGNVHVVPVIADGLVYFGNNDPSGRGGTYLYALDSTTGEEKWKFHANEDGIVTSPAVVDDVVYVTTWAGGLYALDARTGQVKWQYNPRFGLITSPAVAYDTVYITDGGDLHAVNNSTGQQKWRYHTDGSLSTSPVIAGRTVYFLSTRAKDTIPFITKPISEGFLYAVDAQTGRDKWKFEVEALFAYEPAIADEVIYFGGEDGYLYAVR
jgi:eukaryotic-like serine/threonine-protein kinase